MSEPLSRYGRFSPLGAGWRRPTFGEFVQQVEHQFGLGAGTSGLMLAGLRPDERLTPADIRLLCGQLGLPPEDFGA